MRTVIRCVPILSGMTCRTIQPEHPGMEGRVAVAARTSGGESRELSRCVALLARQPGVAPRQREFAQVVIEGGIFPTRWVMARRTVRPILPAMFIILLVTGITV
jgi:hypothetical protein